MIEGDRRSQEALKPGDCLYEKGQESAWVVRDILGCGGTSVLYEIGRADGDESFAMKECFPPMDRMNHIYRRTEGIIRPDMKYGQKTFLNEMKQMFQKEVKVSHILRETADARILEIYGMMNIERIVHDGQEYSDVSEGCFLRMERFASPAKKGCFLADILKRHEKEDRTVCCQEAVELIRQILRALDCFHRNGYLHGDIQPGNIYFRDYHEDTWEAEYATLVDFATARKLKEDLKTECITDLRSVFSTPGYTPPELMGTDEDKDENGVRLTLRLGPQVDIYATGCLFLYLISSEIQREIFEEDIRRDGYLAYRDSYLLDEQMNRIECPETARDELRRIIKKALSRRPEERYENAYLMEKDIEGLLQMVRNANRRDPRNNQAYGQVEQERMYTKRIEPVGECYVRRGDLLEELGQKLCVQKDKRFCFLHGIGGDGKSELARAYAQEQRGSLYDREVWLTYRQECDGNLEKLFDLNQIPFSRESYETFGERTLIIVDNIDSVSVHQGEKKLLRELLEHTGNAHVLVTTRQNPPCEDGHKLLMRSRDPEGFAVEVFKQNYEYGGYGNTFPQEAEDAVQELGHLVAFSPLLMMILAIEVRDNREFMKHEDNSRACRVKTCVEDIIGEIRRQGIYDPGIQGMEIFYAVGEEEEIMETNRKDLLEFLFSDVLTLENMKDADKEALLLIAEIPALRMNRQRLEALLGDNAYRCTAHSRISRLIQRGLLQDLGGDIAIHPLIAETAGKNRMLRIEGKERIRLLRRTTENWMMLPRTDREGIWTAGVFLWRQYQKLRKTDPEKERNFDTCFALEANLPGVKESLMEQYPHAETMIMAKITGKDRVRYVAYDVGTKEENELLRIEIRNNTGAVQEGTVTLLSYFTKKKDTLLNLPDDLGGAKVSIIGEGFCQYATDLYGIYFPKELKEIRADAFRKSSLRATLSSDGILRDGLVIPDTVTVIGENAFEKCRNLKGTLVLPESLEQLGKAAFAECDGLTGALRLPEKLTRIEDWAFGYCSGFNNEELQLPEGLEVIGDGAFGYCSNLQGKLKFPKKLIGIGIGAFFDCEKLSGVELPDTLQSIADHAFRGCKGLSGNLRLPSDLSSLGRSAFEGCLNLTGGLTIPDGLTVIESCAFSGCRGFNGKLKLPDTIHSIKDSAFRDCVGFCGRLVLPNRLTTIGTYAFFNCSGFSDELNLTNCLSLEVIDDSAFSGCSGFDGELKLPILMDKINNGVFSGCIRLKGKLKLPPLLKSIGSCAFKDCVSFTGKLKLPVFLESIESEAFKGCRGFCDELELPEDLISIAYGAFSGCSGLTGVLEIPQNVSQIFQDTFANCSGLSGDLKAANDVKIDRNAFRNCERFNYHINNDDEGIDSDTFELVGMADGTSLIDSMEGGLKLKSSLTYIGMAAFANRDDLCGTLHLPDTIECIDRCAFYGCSGLSGTLQLPINLKEIGEEAFCYCKGFIGNLEIPNGVTIVKQHTFMNCSGLDGQLVLPETLLTIESDAFSGCSGLKGNLTLPNSLKSIDRRAFIGCNFSGNIAMPESVLYIHMSAFDWAKLRSVVFYNARTEIEGIMISPDGLLVYPIVYGYRHSTAEEYAIKHHYEFRIIKME